MLAIPVDQARVWASPDHTTERPVGGVMSGGGIDESDRPAPAEPPNARPSSYVQRAYSH